MTPLITKHWCVIEVEQQSEDVYHNYNDQHVFRREHGET